MVVSVYSGTIEASYGIQFFVYRFSDLNIYIGFAMSINFIYIKLQKKLISIKLSTLSITKMDTLT